MTYRTGFIGSVGVHYDAPRLVAPGLGAVAASSATSEKAAREAAGRAQLQATPKVTFTARAAPVSNGVAQAAPTITSMWPTWNTQAARVMAPFSGAIARLPITPAKQTQLRLQPLDAFIDMFDPIEDAAGRAIDRVLLRTGPVVDFLGGRKNAARFQPGDDRADNSTRNLLRRLRTIDSFFILYFSKPVELHAELIKEGINVVGNSIMDVLGVERERVETATVAKSVANTIETAFAVSRYPAGSFKVSSGVSFNGVRQDVYGSKVDDVLTYYRLTPAAWLVEWDKKADAVRAAARATGFVSEAQIAQMVFSQLGPRPTTGVNGLGGLGASGAEEALTASVVESLCALCGVPAESTVAGIIGVIVDVVIGAAVTGGTVAATVAVSTALKGGTLQDATRAGVSAGVSAGANAAVTRGGAAASSAGLPVLTLPPSSSSPPTAPSTALVPRSPIVTTVSPVATPVAPGSAPIAPVSSSKQGLSPVVAVVGGLAVGFLVVKALSR